MRTTNLAAARRETRQPRFHTVFRVDGKALAGVAKTPEPREQRSGSGPAKPVGAPQTLWATKPLTLASGRAVAVRKEPGGAFSVALATSQGLSWVDASKHLTRAQVTAWLAQGGFSR